YQGSSLVLTSGHGVSPFRGTNMVRRIDPTDARERYAIRDFNGVRIAAEIIKARLANGWSLDYALASAAESEPLESHRANDRRPPFAIRRSALSFGDRVSHYSTLRHRRIDGSIEQVALDETSFSMPYPETREGRYQRVMVIRNDGATRFSEPGDSGSMIVDWTGEVVGTVLGSSDGADIAYALPIAGLRGQLDEWATVFFKDGE
ncbi:MAG: hypothetical protein KC766_11000, partial [Myxococcales bacterium]|nr:hypothetical protein [Myxococcales bacterium]